MMTGTKVENKFVINNCLYLDLCKIAKICRILTLFKIPILWMLPDAAVTNLLPMLVYIARLMRMSNSDVPSSKIMVYKSCWIYGLVGNTFAHNVGSERNYGCKSLRFVRMALLGKNKAILCARMSGNMV
jgi:hypothetical protein